MAATSTSTLAAVNHLDSSTSWADKLQELDPKSFVQAFFNKSTRPDGRLFSQCRSTKISRGVLKLRTIGSSMVNNVICGVTLQVGTPSIPNQGDVLVQSQQHQSVLQEIITNMVDLTSLSIADAPDEAFRLVVTLHSLDPTTTTTDITYFDSSILAALAALQDTQLPTVTQRNAQTKRLEIVASSTTRDSSLSSMTSPLVLHHLAVPLTVGIYRDANSQQKKVHLIADPTNVEQVLLEGTLTMAVTIDKEILFLSHSSKVGLERKDLAVCAHMAFNRAKEIGKLLSSE